MYATSKIRKPWGTITHPKERNPNNLLGYQKLSAKKINDLTNRLYQEDWHEKREKARSARKGEKTAGVKRTAHEVEVIVIRLGHKADRNVTDSNRTGAMSQMGIFNTFACKGWN